LLGDLIDQATTVDGGIVMHTRWRHALILLIASAAIGEGASSVATGAPLPIVQTQAPCTTPSGWCMSFLNSDPIPIIRSMKFTAPAKGSALVTFHGSMLCGGGGGDHRAVDLVSGIVTRAAEVVDPQRPGGLRHATVLNSTPSIGADDSFNLTSTRVYAFAKGETQTFQFKIVKQRMDAVTGCDVYNAAFTVEFIPSNGPDLLKTQEPCSAKNWCLTFDRYGDLRTARNIAFNAPAAGTAVVTFHGTMYCATESTTDSLISAATQIVDTPQASVSQFDSGGLYHISMLHGKTNIGSSDSFNLASTRAFPVAAGQHTFYFRIESLVVDPGVACYVYNAALTIRFIPTAGSGLVVAQDKCADFGDCATVGPGLIAAINVRTLRFKPPRDGTAIVTFHGAIYCTYSATGSNAIIQTQITTSSDGTDALPDGPGGLLQQRFGAGYLYDSFNLAATRAVTLKAGKTKTFYLVLSGAASDGVKCTVQTNAAFTLKFDG
jgi:hypothetical protein